MSSAESANTFGPNTSFDNQHDNSWLCLSEQDAFEGGTPKAEEKVDHFEDRHLDELQARILINSNLRLHRNGQKEKF